MKTLVKLLFIFIPFIFIQCNKESIVNDQVEILNTPSAMCNLPDLGVQGINEGDFHNYLCNLIIDSLQICPEYPTEVSERIVEILIKNKGKICNDWNFDTAAYADLLNSVDMSGIIYKTMTYDGYWFDSLDNLGLSPKFKDEILDLYEGLSNLSIVNYPTINNFICDFYMENKDSVVSAKDKYLFDIFIDVVNKSAYFWLPVSDGGLGGENKWLEMEEILCPNFNELQVRDWPIKLKPFKFMMADATGLLTSASVSVVATGGLSAVPNPLLGGEKVD